MSDNLIQMLEGLNDCGCGGGGAPRSPYSLRLAGLENIDAGARLRNALLGALALGGVSYLGARHMERRREASGSRERAVTRFLNNLERDGVGRQRSSRTRRGR